jgi:hypothetical protein
MLIFGVILTTPIAKIIIMELNTRTLLYFLSSAWYALIPFLSSISTVACFAFKI